MASSSVAPTSDSLTPEELEAKEAELEAKFAEGTRCIKSNEIDSAVELFFDVLESRIELYGDLGLECASAYFKYGSCLFYKAQDEADFLGASMQDAANQRDGAISRNATEGQGEQKGGSNDEDGSDKGKGKAPIPDEDAGDVEEGDADKEGDEDEDDSEKTDMELAWENLETAKLIYNNNMDKLNDEQRLSLAEVHERLADLSMEKEDYETCMTDFKAALGMFNELLPACDRRLASLHFKMALALQFMDEPEDGLSHCQEALKLMESKLEELKNLVPEGNVEEKAADTSADDIQGVLEDLRDKEVELKEVIAQNATTKELIKNAFAQFGGLGGGAAPTGDVVDLGIVGGSSGKKRTTPAPATAAAPFAENATQMGVGKAALPDEKRKRTLEDLMGGDDGGTTTVGFGGE